MPIYEYKCSACEENTEKIQCMSDPPLKDCGKCGTQDSLKKLISSTSFILKGTGWYVTDYKNRGEKKSPEKEKKEQA